MKLTVLGGSSPFTLSFVHALEDRVAHLPSFELCLAGRDGAALERVRHYADSRLAARGWSVSATVDLKEALDGSDFVVQQIRFGGMRGRADDEEAAAALGLVADETLGIAALRRALLAAQPLRELGDQIARFAPDAIVLNLTNPLSLSTGLLVDAGVRRCYGVCELPWTTARDATQALGADVSKLRWDYVGLNHRGFVVSLEVEGIDLLARIRDTVGEELFLGVECDAIRELGALPTKYFRLMTNSRAFAKPGRAMQLEQLRRAILGGLESDPNAAPASLGERVTNWYEEAVVPMLEAFNSSIPRDVVINVRDSSGLVRERLARMDRSSCEVRPEPTCSVEVRRWLDRYEQHEAALVHLMNHPSEAALERAVEFDPLIPAEYRERAVEALADLATVQAERT